jgi:hypothetical protein
MNQRPITNEEGKRSTKLDASFVVQDWPWSAENAPLIGEYRPWPGNPQARPNHAGGRNCQDQDNLDNQITHSSNGNQTASPEQETKQQAKEGRVQAKPTLPAHESTGRAGPKQHVTKPTPPARESTGRTVPGQLVTRKEDEGSPWPTDDTQRAAEYQRCQAEWMAADYQRWQAEWKRSPARPPPEQQGQTQETARVSLGLQGLSQETARESTGLTQEELVHREWEDVMLKRTRLVKKMGGTAFIKMASIIESSGEQTPPQQPREPTAEPASEMPEGQKAEATAKHRRKEEGPKRASFTNPVKANGRTAKRCQAPTARDSQEGIGRKIKRLKRNGPERHISSQPAQPSRERSEGP